MLVSEAGPDGATRHRIIIPKLPFMGKVGQHFTGVGDLIAAVFLAWTSKGTPAAAAAENAVATVQAVLQRTIAGGSSELLLVASRGDIELPVVSCKAERILR